MGGDKDARKDKILEEQETESTTSSFEPTQTVTTMTHDTKKSSQKKLDIVETKSPPGSDITMEGEKEPKALPKPDGETEDDLEKSKEKKPGNQGLGIEETQRLLLG